MFLNPAIFRYLSRSAAMSKSDNLFEKVTTAITANPYLNGRTLRFEAEAGKVVLQGRVATFFQKQMAQEALRRIEGVNEIENRLEVC
jgi:osmotically-inducible protein OsmY